MRRVIAVGWVVAFLAVLPEPSRAGPGTPSCLNESESDDAKKACRCVEALDREFGALIPALTAALGRKAPLERHWAAECGKAKEPREIVADLLPPEQVAALLDPPDGRGVAGRAGDRVAGTGRLVDIGDLAGLFDGRRGGSMANLTGPGPGVGGASGAGVKEKTQPEQLREAFDLPQLADVKKLSGMLLSEVKTDWSRTEQGRELLGLWKEHGISGVPIVLGTIEDEGKGGFYDPNAKLLAVNAALVTKSYPWAEGKDDFQLAAYLVSHPAERGEMLYDISDMLFHEGWHAAQFAQRPLQAAYDVPAKDYLPLEEEAKLRGASYFMQRVALEKKTGKKHLLESDNVYLAAQRSEALVLSAYGSDRFRKDVRDLYASREGDAAMGFGDAIKLQKDRLKTAFSPLKKKALEDGLRVLGEAEAFYKTELPRLAKQAVQGSPRYMVAMGESLVTGSPDKALVALYIGVEGLNASEPKWVQENSPRLRATFDKAIDAEKSALKKECGARPGEPACVQRKTNLEDACRYIGRDPC
ncbi:MAG: hypothetical protein HZB91_14040 [Elusimicrobia bacterium]|nr:hypothetical protein [Elusimicrobiota bacterium]